MTFDEYAEINQGRRGPPHPPLTEMPTFPDDDAGRRAFALGWNACAKQIAETKPVGYVNGDELDNMLDDRTATIQSNPSGLRKTPIFTSLAKVTNCELTIDALAEEIRRVDGNHDLGAGALAEALMPFLERFWS